MGILFHLQHILHDYRTSQTDFSSSGTDFRYLSQYGRIKGPLLGKILFFSELYVFDERANLLSNQTHFNERNRFLKLF